ncbi:MAG: hypothetical protein ACXWXA_08300 [Candidatus Limnocylindrales bacterium]
MGLVRGHGSRGDKDEDDRVRGASRVMADADLVGVIARRGLVLVVLGHGGKCGRGKKRGDGEGRSDPNDPLAMSWCAHRLLLLPGGSGA